MIGLVIITHGKLATELIRSAEMIVGPLDKVMSVALEKGTSPELATEQLHSAVATVGSDNEGVLILTDLFGGTPTNLSVELLTNDNIEIVTGVNLPMILKGASGRLSKDIIELAVFLKDYGKDAIIRPSELLKSSD